TSLSVSVRFSADSVPPVLRATAETLRILADIVGLVQKSTNRRLDVKDSRRTNMDVSIMIEGQQGLSWPRWQRLVRAAEDLGFDGLYRSDHFVDPSGPYQDALELWVSFTWLAANTQRIQFGPLVSPVWFRDPVITAWQASGIDALAGGRLRLGLGAGWNQREHESFGYDLL